MAVDFLQENEKVLLKIERVIGEGFKQKFIEEVKIVEGIKIVDIVPQLVNVRTIVKEGKVIVQGTLHKQIFYVGTDGLEHHVAEDIDFSELIEVEPVDPAIPVTTGMNETTTAFVENLIFEFDPDTGELIQKVIIGIEVIVTQTEELFVATDILGPVIKAQVVIGRGEKQKFIRQEKNLEAIKIVDIVPRLNNIRLHVKNGKVIVQGVLHKQIFYVGLDNVVHHVAEDIPFSDLVEVIPLDPSLPAREGMNARNHSVIENLVWEFDPDTGQLIQKVIIRLSLQVTETQEVAVALNPYGVLVATEVVIGRGRKQKFIEESKILDAIKIVDIVPSLRDVTSIVKKRVDVMQLYPCQ